MQYSVSNSLRKKGFTFIELIIVLSITSIVFIASNLYIRSAQKKQKIREAAYTFEARMNLAKQKALTGVRSADQPGSLEGQVFTASGGTGNYSSEFYYQQADLSYSRVNDQEYVLSDDSSIVFSHDNEIIFYSVGRGCDSSETFVIESADIEYDCTVSVGCPAGQIERVNCG